ncbi:MAG: formimidoylglutamase [Bacteroidia bacterium]|nr:formimidoylglutamase [Bacteroidia bacterium]
MKFLKTITKQASLNIIKKRKGEVRIGERAEFFTEGISLEKNLEKSKTKFVLLGLPEDIGVRANFGRGGTQTAWKPALENILSLQSNLFFDGSEVFVLGEVNFDDLMEKAEHLSPKQPDELKKMRDLVSIVDERVVVVIEKICAAGKIPIVIGGGHNNAYGNLKGAAKGLKSSSKIKAEKINCINCDAHTDMRPLEGRHSGNGFSYAYEENFLDKYSVLGIHESYNTNAVMQKFENDHKRLFYTTYETIFVREQQTFQDAMKSNIDFVKKNYCGIELDLDSITNVPSSAKTSSGISPVQARQYVYNCAKNLKCAYFHIAEGAPVLAHIKADNKTGKLIGYLVADFIKGINDKK